MICGNGVLLFKEDCGVFCIFLVYRRRPRMRVLVPTEASVMGYPFHLTKYW